MLGVHDVAAYLIREGGSLSILKLHKLLYYCQAWSLVWDRRPLFAEPIVAWATGPVVLELHAVQELTHGALELDVWPVGRPERLDRAARDTVHAVLSSYGRLSSRTLAELICRDTPWREARARAAEAGEAHSEISGETLLLFYGRTEVEEMSSLETSWALWPSLSPLPEPPPASRTGRQARVASPRP